LLRVLLLSLLLTLSATAVLAAEGRPAAGAVFGATAGGAAVAGAEAEEPPPLPGAEGGGPPPLPQAGPIGIPELIGEWVTVSDDGLGNAVHIHAVITGSEWSSTSSKTVLDAFGLPVTYRSAQGGTLEVFPPKTIRFAVFWQEPKTLLPPGSTFSIEELRKDRLLLLDIGCEKQYGRDACLVDYSRWR
jgi:hypothetical protein